MIDNDDRKESHLYKTHYSPKNAHPYAYYGIELVLPMDNLLMTSHFHL